MNLEIGQHWFFWQICNFCHLLILFLTIFYHFDNPEDFWHLRTRIHDNHCNLKIKSDSGQHSQFWRSFQWDYIVHTEPLCALCSLRGAVKVVHMFPMRHNVHAQRCCEGTLRLNFSHGLWKPLDFDSSILLTRERVQWNVFILANWKFWQFL